MRTVIAGYHWFTDWGRDTMISLEGLTLATGRHAEAGYILRTFAHYVRDGLIPNLFPEGENEGLYHTADATLWFFHALDRYLDGHRRPRDARSCCCRRCSTSSSTTCAARASASASTRPTACCGRGAEGYQLTWMDAKVDDWVVTPRRGKAVEINALWYNALRLLERLAARGGDGDGGRRRCAEHAERARASFNERFWYAAGGYLYDVVDGEDGRRPGLPAQPGLRHLAAAPGARPGALGRRCWTSVRERLLTPVGPALARPGPSRLQAALLRRPARPRRRLPPGHGLGLADRPVRRRLAQASTPTTATAPAASSTGFDAHLGEACIGSISEVFDAEAPYTPRGCVAQAWSVAEVLRGWLKCHATSLAPGLPLSIESSRGGNPWQEIDRPS